MTHLPSSLRYSLLVFAPLLALLLLPVPCLGTQCVLLASIRLVDPLSLDLQGLAGFCAWGLGPLPAAALIVACGLVVYRRTRRTRPAQVSRVAVWTVFSLTAFAVAWYAIILVTSIGATETPPEKFLAITALMALTVIVVGQPLVLVWLSLVSRIWHAQSERQPSPY